MMKILLVAALCFVSCFSAPLSTAPPATTVPTESAGGEDPSANTPAQVRDIMMDPSAKMPWQRQEGDITYLTDKFLFPEDPEDPFFTLPDNGQRSKRAAVRDRYRLWRDGVIPYFVSSYFTDWQHYQVMRAMSHWENYTCIRFIPRTTERDFIEIFPGGGCYSYVGRIGSNQGVSVGSSCFSFQSAVHELGHVIGFYHEQSRPDRDEHVRIVEENLSGGHSNFERKDESDVNSYGVGYDYNSIMHYDENLFSNNGQPTIVAHDPEIPLGRATTLSELDIEQTKRLYNCPAVPPPRQTVVEEVVYDRPPFPEELPYPNCGGFITDLHGNIESPGFSDGEYPHNIDCVWLFRLPLSGFNIGFTFQPFHVEQSPNCESDYIQIYESLDKSGYTSGKKCGNFFSYFSISSLKSLAYLHFHTNGSNETPNLKGFRLTYNAYDIDECDPYYPICSHGCRNFPGGYECSCPEGFFLSSDGKTCFDVNECGLDKGGCDHKCVNRAGTYRCECDDGYTLLGDNRTCIADGAELPDACAINNGGCSHTCTVSGTIALCGCRAGYELAVDRRSCNLIDPCATNNGGCTQTCTASGESAVCSCRSGYELATDRRTCNMIDPCATNNGGCEQVCTASGESAVCSCRSGYELATDGRTCNMIDPCATNNGGCAHMCTASGESAVCSCQSGYELATDGRTCNMIDPCATNNGGCEQVCTASGESAVCSCQSGYELATDGRTCNMIDPCATNNGGCEQVCTASGDSAVCSCRAGYQLDSTDSRSCTDIDECASNGGKGNCDQICTNTPGSRVCSCSAGYELNEDGITCEDIDECKDNNGGCRHGQCINSEGSFHCGCEEGFEMIDGTSCASILRGPSGQLTSDNWPATYPVNVDEQWIIECEANQLVQLTFASGFGIAGRLPECAKDWLKVYDGDSTSANLFGTYCYYDVPNVPKSSTNRLLVHFYAGPAHSSTRRGFEFTYTCENVETIQTVPEDHVDDRVSETPSELPAQPSQCGQTLFTANTGTIETPNWPETYPTHLTCEYFIQLPNEGDTIEITFGERFGIAGNYPACEKDWVKIYDGHTDDSDLFGTYCHYQTPPVITTSGSKAKIVLYAGPAHHSSRKGFTATYTSRST